MSYVLVQIVVILHIYILYIKVIKQKNKKKKHQFHTKLYLCFYDDLNVKCCLFCLGEMCISILCVVCNKNMHFNT